MNWYDIDEILINGNKEQIENIICPDCGSKISYKYGEQYGSMEIKCPNCYYLSRTYRFPFPNCVKFFGYENTV